MSLLDSYINYDLDEHEQAREEAKEKAATESSNRFKTQSGENVLRLLPTPTAWVPWFKAQGIAPNPFLIGWFHFWERHDKPGHYIAFPCPQEMASKPCLACEEARKLNASQHDLERKMAEDMQPKHKAICNVIDRDNEDRGPLILEVSYPYRKHKGKTQWEKINAIMTGARTRTNLIDPVNGYDFVIKKDGEGLDTTYTCSPVRRESPLNDDDEVAIGWIDSQPDIREYVELPTMAQMAAILAGSAMSPRELNADGSKKFGEGGEVNMLPTQTQAQPAISAPAASTRDVIETADDYIGADSGVEEDSKLKF